MTTIPLYAASADCWGASSWTGVVAAPSNAASLLRFASMLVRDATAAALYPCDPSTNLPTDADVLLAFKEATCAHAAAMSAAGVDPDAAGTDSAIKASAIGSASVSYTFADRAAAAKAALSTNLCQTSLMILRSAGLLANPPMTSRGMTV